MLLLYIFLFTTLLLIITENILFELTELGHGITEKAGAIQ